MRPRSTGPDVKIVRSRSFRGVLMTMFSVIVDLKKHCLKTGQRAEIELDDLLSR